MYRVVQPRDFPCAASSARIFCDDQNSRRCVIFRSSEMERIATSRILFLSLSTRSSNSTNHSAMPTWPSMYKLRISVRTFSCSWATFLSQYDRIPLCPTIGSSNGRSWYMASGANRVKFGVFRSPRATVGIHDPPKLRSGQLGHFCQFRTMWRPAVLCISNRCATPETCPQALLLSTFNQQYSTHGYQQSFSKNNRTLGIFM